MTGKRTLNRTQLLTYLLILGLGLVLRLYNFGNYSFLFDQVQIYENSLKIVEGTPTLIGPRTGPAPMYTGPLIYYLNAISLEFINNPYSLIVTSTIINFATGISLIYLTRRYLTTSYYLLIPMLWAFSPLLITLDRVVWNPNLILLSSALVFFPLLKQERLKLSDILIIASGVFLGYQAHFTGLFLAPLAIIGLVIRKELQLWGLFIIGLTALASLAPTIIFDLRHDWLNLRGLIGLVGNSVEVNHRLSIIDIGKILLIHLESLGAILFSPQEYSLKLTVGVLLLLLFFIGENSSNRPKYLVGLWLGFIVISFSLYRRPIPEYYLMIQYPVFFYIVALLLVDVWSKKLSRVRVSMLFSVSILVMSGMYVTKQYGQETGVSIKTGLATQNTIESYAKQQPIKSIVYDMEEVNSVGLRFLLDGIPTDDSGYDYHLIYPINDDNLETQRLGHTLSLWIDPRIDPESNYVSRSDHIIGTNTLYHLLEEHTDKPWNSRFSYLVFNKENTYLARILMIPEAKYLPEFKPVDPQDNLKLDTWHEILIEGKTWYYRYFNGYTYLLEPYASNFNPTEIELLQ